MTDDRSPSPTPSASIVVVSYNTSAHIEACLLSLLELDYPPVEIIVVDNASTDGSVELVRTRFPDVEVVEMDANRGFAGGASVGLYMATGDIVATVNPDVRLDPGWMRAVRDALYSEGDVGVVGSKILYPDGVTIQHAGGNVDYPLATTWHNGRGEADKGQYNYAREVPFVTGAALAMLRDAGRSLHYFDEEYFPMYYEDVDLCWRARREGLRVVYEPSALAYHKESVTVDRRSGQYYTYYHVNRLRFVTKQYAPEQVMLDFLPAEAARVSGHMPAEDRRASLSLLENKAAPDGIETDGVPALQRLDALQAGVDEVMSGWRVREKPFTSGVPLLGGAVVRLRERLNNLSTRWYVRPILQQQVDYNASVARTLREMAGQISELQARVRVDALLTSGLVSQRGASSVQSLASELEELRARLDHLELETARSHDNDMHAQTQRAGRK